MLFDAAFSPKALAPLCRWLRHGLEAGLSLTHVVTQMSQKGPEEVRPAVNRVAYRLKQGGSLEDALAEEERFPQLFRDLAAAGEQTGHLPEVFRELEEYYDTQITIRRRFIQEITWPIVQFVLAILVIAFLIFILGWVAESRGGDPIEPIGLGLSGASGAIIFLVGVVSIVVGGFLLYRYLSRKVRYWAKVEAKLLKVPAIGPCLDALAMQRFCLCLRLTSEVGMSAPAAVKQSLKATGNAAFQQNQKKAIKVLKSGGELVPALRKCNVFTDEFLQSLGVAEETGQVPEVLARLTDQYREEASRRLSALSRVASFAVWGMVAVFITIMIFRIASVYLGILDSVGV